MTQNKSNIAPTNGDKEFREFTAIVFGGEGILRFGVDFLLNSWGFSTIVGDSLSSIVSQKKASSLRPNVLVIPLMKTVDTGDYLSSHLASEVGYKLPWIGISPDINSHRHEQSGAFGGIILNMPCPPETFRAALLKVLKPEG